MNNKGISAVVATVLIILITVAAIGIVWIGFLPLFQDAGSEVYYDLDLDVVLEGYTVYDPAENFAFVQVGRGSDNQEVAAIEVIFYFNGSSYGYLREDVPSSNEKKTYAFNFSRDGLSGVPDKVSVAPVMQIGDTRKFGKVVSEKSIPINKLNLGEEEWQDANEDSKDSLVKVSSGVYREKSKCNGEQEEIEGDCYTPLTDCGDIIDSGKYFLKNDVESASGENCFNIESDDVVLNLNGKTIEGNSEKIGVFGREITDIEIFNGDVSNFNNGVYLQNCRGAYLHDLNTSFNQFTGIVVFGYDGSLDVFVMEDIISNSNGEGGLKLTEVSNMLLKNIGLESNSYFGLRFKGNNSRIERIIARDNDWSGLEIEGFAGMKDNLVVKDIISNSGNGPFFKGVTFSHLNNSQIINITANQNSGEGIKLRSSSYNNFTDIEVCDNDEGIVCEHVCDNNLLIGSNQLQNVDGCGWILGDDYSNCD